MLNVEFYLLVEILGAMDCERKTAKLRPYLLGFICTFFAYFFVFRAYLHILPAVTWYYKRLQRPFLECKNKVPFITLRGSILEIFIHKNFAFFPDLTTY